MAEKKRKQASIKTSVKSGNFRPTKAGAGMTQKGVDAVNRKTGVEFTLSTPEKGSLLVNGNLIQISYSGRPDSPVGFEMLDGLQTGLNGTWGVSYQRTLANNLQLSINYNGRQSPGIPVIHTGGVQARAFF